MDLLTGDLRFNPRLLEFMEKDRTRIERAMLKPETPETAEQVQSLASQKITAVFTSTNAVEAIINQFSKAPDWSIYCLGGVTKDLVYNFFGESAVAATSASATTDSVGDELTVPVGICASGFSGDGGDEVCSSSGRSCCGTVSLIVHSFQLTDISGKFDVKSSLHELMVDP